MKKIILTLAIAAAAAVSANAQIIVGAGYQNADMTTTDTN